MTDAEQTAASGDVSKFAGSWILEKNENFEAFLSANGVIWPVRKMAVSSTPVLDVTQEGDKFSFKLHSLMITKETHITVGETSEEKQHSGDIMLCTPSWDGEKLVLEMKPKDAASKVKPQKHTRHVEDDKLVLTLEVDDVVAKRIFKRNKKE